MPAANSPIYLDNAATTRPLPAVVELMHRVQLESFGNPSSRHCFGARPRQLVADARAFLLGTFCAADLVFTSGGTEADLLGVLGAASVRPPGRILVGAADHPAILAQAPLLRRFGHRMTQVPVTADGTTDPEALFDLLGSDVRAVAILHGHNELGSLAEVEELVSLVRRVAPEAHVHIDLVQAYGKINFDLDTSGADSAAISAHKFHGPRGIGCLALSSKAQVGPLQAGGGQETGLRGGTENVAAVVGMCAAADHCFSDLAATTAHTTGLADLVFGRLQAEFDDALRLGNPHHRLPHILSMRIPGIASNALADLANARGIAFSTGSACHHADQENPVLAAAGLSRRAADEVIRLSFAADTTVAEAEAASATLVELALQLEASASATEGSR